MVKSTLLVFADFGSLKMSVLTFSSETQFDAFLGQPTRDDTTNPLNSSGLLAFMHSFVNHEQKK